MSTADRIGLACVQARTRVQHFASAETFAAVVDDLMEKAVRALPADVPRLVVFPEDFASGCIFIGDEEVVRDATSLRGAVAALVKRHFAGVMAQRVRHRVGWVRALALHRARDVAQVYFDTFAAAARRYGVYVLAGSVLLPELEAERDNPAPTGGDVYNVSYLFGPDGEIVGSQRKAFLIELEGRDNLDLVAGSVDELAVFDTELGRIGIAICFDAFQQPVVEHFAALDVDILLQPSANPQPWSEAQQHDWLNGTWKAVRLEGIATYGVNPMLVGNLIDIEFEGQSSIVAKDAAVLGAGGTATEGPALGFASLPPRAGFVAVASGWTAEEIVAAVVPHPRALDRG